VQVASIGLISWRFLMYIGHFQNQVHRRAAENAKVDSFLLSAERAESRKIPLSDLLDYFWFQNPCALPAYRQAGAPLR